MNDDHTLLRRHAESGDEAAFRALIERHLGLVYHAALRQLGGDAHRARDAVQTVFTDLSRKAPSLSRRPVVLAGWLHTATRHSCARIRRAEHRRQVRENEAARMNSEPFAPSAQGLPDSASVDWDRLRPVIDEALHALSERDREAVLLRFFEGRAYAEIGARLALSDDAARRRVERALEKLRAVLARRGVESASAALGLTLGAQAGLAPPAGLAAHIGTAALAGLAASGGMATSGGILLGATSKTIIAAAGTMLAALALGVGYAITGRPASRLPAPAVDPLAAPSLAAATLTVADLFGQDFKQHLRRASASDFGRLLAELWQLGTPSARTRFREVFDHWCLLDPEAASRWAVITRSSAIGSPDGQMLREQSALAWAARDLDGAYAWALDQPDEASFQGLASMLLRNLARTDPSTAVDLARLGTREMRRAVLYDIFAIWARSAPLAALAALKMDPKIEESANISNRIHAIWAESAPVSATHHLLSTSLNRKQADRDNLTSWYMSTGDYSINVPAVAQATLAWWNDLPGDKNPHDFPTWGMGEAIRGWLGSDPTQALAFVDTLAPESLRQLMLDRIAGTSGVLTKHPSEPLDPAIAFALFGRMTDDGKRERWTASYVQKWAQANPENALAWSREQPDEKLGLAAQAGAFRAIAAQEPETAVAAWKTMPPNEDLALALAEGWAEKAPADAVAWFSNLYPEPSSGIWTQDLLTSWMKKDPEAATAWAEKNARGQAAKAALQATQVVQLPKGLAYTVRLAPDSRARVEWLKNRAAWWLQKDPAAATKFLTETPLLTNEEKAKLLAAEMPAW